MTSRPSLGALPADLVRPVPVDSTGRLGPTKRQAGGPHWRQTSRGLFVPAEVNATAPQQRIVEAAAVLPEVGGVTGWAALHWWGAAWLDGTDRDSRSTQLVDLATCYQDIRSQPGFRVRQERLGPGELMVHRGIRLTTPVRSLFYALRYADSLTSAVVIADMAAYADLVSLTEATAYALAHPGWTGVPQAREALGLAEENSWSPRESTFRMLWQLAAGLPVPLCNPPVFDLAGHLIGAPDLLDVETGLAGEYAGALHLEGHRLSRDLRRDEHFRDHGLEPVTFLAGDLQDPAAVVRRLHRARARALAADRPRRWTLELPARWQPTHTVDLRRALDDDDRERLLAHRRRVA